MNLIQHAEKKEGWVYLPIQWYLEDPLNRSLNVSHIVGLHRVRKSLREGENTSLPVQLC